MHRGAGFSIPASLSALGAFCLGGACRGRVAVSRVGWAEKLERRPTAGHDGLAR
jgi:hypothetical protein